MGGAGLRSFKFLYDFGVFKEELHLKYSYLFQLFEGILSCASHVGPDLALSVSFFLLLAKPAFKKYQGLESRFCISQATLHIPKTASQRSIDCAGERAPPHMAHLAHIGACAGKAALSAGIHGHCLLSPSVDSSWTAPHGTPV